MYQEFPKETLYDIHQWGMTTVMTDKSWCIIIIIILAAWWRSRPNERELGVFEASDTAGCQVSEDHEPAVEGWKGQHDVSYTGHCQSISVTSTINL